MEGVVLHEPEAGADFEKRIAKAVEGALIEFRLSELEKKVEEIEVTLQSVATKADVQGIHKSLNEANAEAKTARDLISKRRFEWWKTILGGASAGVIVGLAMLAFGKVHF